MRLFVLLLIGAALQGCSTMRDRPTLDRMDAWFKKLKYVEAFESDKTPAELLSAARSAGCQNWDTTTSGTAVIGPNTTAPVTTTMRFSVDSGVFGPGGVWAGLNGDGLMVHEVVMAFKAFPNGSGSKVEVAPVKSGMGDQLKRAVEEGNLFCDWQRFSDPWRM